MSLSSDSGTLVCQGTIRLPSPTLIAAPMVAASKTTVRKDEPNRSSSHVDSSIVGGVA